MRIFRRRKPIYYGWTIATVLAITETVSYGVIVYAFTVFITPMEADLGWSRAEISGAFSLFFLITGIFAFPVGYWLDKHGSRLLMTLGSIGATVSVLLWSQVRTLPEFLAVMSLMGVFGAAVLYEPAFTVIAAWFKGNRGTAMALVTFVAGFASTIFIPLTDALLVAYGWRQAVLVLGIVLGAITIPLHGLFLRRRPADLGLTLDGEIETEAPVPGPQIEMRQVLRSRYFWILTLAFALSTFSLYAIRFHFIPLMISVGIGASSAAIAGGAVGVMQVAGRMLYAPIERRVSSKTMAVGVLALATVSLAVLMTGSSAFIIALFVILFGMSIGTHTLTRPLLVADSYDSAFFGRINSAMVIFVTIAYTVAPFAAGLIFDLYASYQPMLLLGVGLSLASVILILFLPRRRE